MNLYRTIFQEASAEQIIEKSKFIASVKPVENRSQAELFFQEIRIGNRGATHHVPIYVIGKGQEQQWASDDGEPSGTAGAPVLHMIVKEGLTDLAVVITRYFGGVKLGPGGLLRAYIGTAKLALAEAGLAQVREVLEVVTSIEYGSLGKVQNNATEGSYSIERIQYEDVVKLTLRMDLEQLEPVKQWFLDLTGGECRKDFEESLKMLVKSKYNR